MNTLFQLLATTSGGAAKPTLGDLMPKWHRQVDALAPAPEVPAHQRLRQLLGGGA